ncbi:hypothetical protein [Flavobacterium branchiicola]|uniref:Uncharacterized protein n=1 Tax=Flavobacterium branchiicola TaxID=1114875 RepID=A0ABV9PKX1_9FLAO|nr:hypothetical protein [Flavobacterium branchiicola]MBS7256290.1 hypothetical protein [Flavobacterium branchiicola]
MKNHLKYLISLFVALVVMAGDGILYSQSNSPEYYQSSFVISRKEIDLKSLRVYVFNRKKLVEKFSFLRFLKCLKIEKIVCFQTTILLQLFKNLQYDINEFISQWVFVNEIITSGNFKKSLDIA